VRIEIWDHDAEKSDDFQYGFSLFECFIFFPSFLLSCFPSYSYDCRGHVVLDVDVQHTEENWIVLQPRKVGERVSGKVRVMVTTGIQAKE
jgi:hypothetical protein